MHTLLLHRTLPLFALPLGFSLLCMAAALRWRRKVLVAAPLVLLTVFSLPVVSDVLMHLLEDRFPRVPTAACPTADAIFPLGGMLGVRGRPGDPVELKESGARFERGLELYFARRAPTLLLSGAWNSLPGVPSEGELLRGVAIARGVPASAIVVTPIVPNTEAEAVVLRDLAAARGWKRVIVVTSAFHMFRAARLFRKCGVEIVPVPADFRAKPPSAIQVFDFLPGAEALFRSEIALHEYLGVLFYSVVGSD